MRIKTSLVMASTAALLAGMFDPSSVQARSRGFGGIGGIAAGAAMIGIMSGGARYSGSRSRHRHGGDEDSDSSRGSRDKSSDDRVLATIGAPSTQRQAAILKSIELNDDIGEVGTKSVVKIGITASSEAERDDTKSINDIIARFKSEQAKSDVAGDVTAHAIEQSLARAFKDSKLDIFESFVGENWSSERLRVMILDRVQAEIDQLFRGNNRGNAPMEELDQLIQRSAQSVYHRLFEISELLAANRSTALFAQRLYQTQGNLVDEQLREVTDRMLVKAANAPVAQYEGLMRRDSDGVALRYRAERIVLDCLSENVAKVTSSETGVATVGEIEQKIGQTAAVECSGWLAFQFGNEKIQLKPQRPMPLRAVWSPNGPKDDPSMYGRISGPL
jgi:hypothetical protein